MRARNVIRLRIVAAVTVASAALGVVLTSQTNSLGIAGDAVVGGLTGSTLAAVEIALQGPARARLQRFPVWLVFAFRVIIYGAVFLAAPEIGGAAMRVFAHSSAAGARLGIPASGAIAAAIGFNAFFLARALIGPSTLMAFLLGRYHRPRLEERLVLFLDLRGSTGLAERLGDLAFHRFLNQLAEDLADPVVETKGEIYRYVGDEIIISWRLASAEEGAAAVGCLPAIEDVLSERRSEYLAEFGVLPQLRGALHAGSLVVGEMGRSKREIVMLGDTMNTAARIEEVCRETGRDYIASGAALSVAGPLPAGLRAVALGPMALRGKEEQIELFALSREPREVQSPQDIAAQNPAAAQRIIVQTSPRDAAAGIEFSMKRLYDGPVFSPIRISE